MSLCDCVCLSVLCFFVCMFACVCLSVCVGESVCVSVCYLRHDRHPIKILSKSEGVHHKGGPYEGVHVLSTPGNVCLANAELTDARGSTLN